MKSLILSLLTSLTLISHAAQAGKAWGDEVTLGNGTARSFIEMDENLKPVTLGIALKGDTLNGLPDSGDPEYEYILSLPESVCLAPFKHIGLNWNPHGHEPTEIYGAPHFDFHFYTISEDARHEITCSGDDEAVCMKQPDTDMLPEFYAPTPAGVPMMGWHWYDTRSPEFHGQPFTATFIYGFYNGKVAFVEPMITREYLMNHGSVDNDFPVPAKVGESGYYPSHYVVQYNSVEDTTYISLTNFNHMSAE